MASFQNAQNSQNPCFNVHRRSQPSGSIQKSKFARFKYADVNTILSRNTKNPNSQSSEQERECRESESTPGWHPIAEKKRPKSDGDARTSKALRFSPYAGSAQPLPKSEERSLKRVNMASVQNAQNPIVNRQSLPASLSVNSILPQNTKNPNSQSREQGRKCRESESTPGWHPIAEKKRPKSDGDASTSKALSFSPYAGSAQPSPKSEERSLKRLSDDLWGDHLVTRQAPQRYAQKLQLRDNLSSIFTSAFPGCSLHICGSTCNGLATNESDIDLCLLLPKTLLPKRRKINKKSEARVILHQLNNMLKRSTYVQRCHVIYAKVPILKFRDSESGCYCNLNINNTVGIKNTHLLQGYCGYDLRVSPLIMIVKKWAKRHHINEASQGTLSSYSIAMMVLHYLQEPCKPPVVPSLQMAYPDIFDEKRNILDISLENPSTRIPNGGSKNQESLGELLVGFFRYYAEQFRWEDYVISVRRGRKYPRGSSRVWSNKFICIEEPFDLSCVARAVHSQKKFNAIIQRIKTAYYKLTVSPSLESIMSGS